MTRELRFANVDELPAGMTTPAEALEGPWNRNETLAGAVEDALDWIESDPPDPRASRRMFSAGHRVINVQSGGEAWTIIWVEDEPDRPRVLLIAEETSL